MSGLLNAYVHVKIQVGDDTRRNISFILDDISKLYFIYGLVYVIELPRGTQFFNNFLIILLQ
jgi:hypothetical protein